MNNNGCIIPEIDEQNIGVQQENATFLVIGDEAYTSEIIEEYNRNAAAKTEEFNTNATNKTNDFNTNYDDKLKAFNSNAVTKTEDFDSHVTAQTTNFNNNAETATVNFNKNAAQQTDEFNKNAMSYSQSIEENKKNIASTSNELYRLKTDILETGESSGKNINLEDSAWAEMQEIKVDGVLSQETTNGYQLFDVSKVTTISNGTIENEIVTSNVLSGNGQGVTYNFPSITLTANTAYYIFADIRIKSGTGSVNGINNGAVGWEMVSSPSLSKNYNTFISKYTPTENEKMYAVYLGFIDANDLIINVQNVMITTDRNATYEKYTGNQPSPSPDFPQEIKTITGNLKITSCGKNLIERMVLGELNTKTGIFEQSSTVICNEHYIPYDGLKQYYIKIDNAPSTANIRWYNQKLEYIGYGTTQSSGIINKYVYTDLTSSVPSDTTPKYFKIRRADATLLNSTWCVSTDANYFGEYVESQIQAKLPENEFFGKLDDTYKDTLRAEYNKDDRQYHLMLDKMIGHKNFNNETTILYSELQGDYFLFQIIIGYLPSAVMISNNFINKSNYGLSYNYESIYRGGSGNRAFQFKVKKERVASYDNAGALSFIKNSNTEVYYALETPYTIDLGVIDMPLTYDEITNIFTDSDLLPTINVKYYRNFIATIQNLQVNNDTLKNELSNIESRLTALESANTNIESRLTTLENANKNVADSNPTEESEVTE